MPKTKPAAVPRIPPPTKEIIIFFTFFSLILKLRYQIARFRKPIDEYIEEPLIEEQLQLA